MSRSGFWICSGGRSYTGSDLSPKIARHEQIQTPVPARDSQSQADGKLADGRSDEREQTKN